MTLFCILLLLLILSNFCWYNKPLSTFGSRGMLSLKQPWARSTNSVFLSNFFCPRHSSYHFNSSMLHSKGSFTIFGPGISFSSSQSSDKMQLSIALPAISYNVCPQSYSNILFVQLLRINCDVTKTERY